MPLSVAQYSFNGLTFGASTDFGIKRVEGLAPPDQRVFEAAKPQAHGSFVSAPFAGPRRITLTGVINGQGDLESRVTSWRQAFAPQDADLPLQFNYGSLRRINCIPVRRFFPVDAVYLGAKILPEWTVEMLAADPRIYDDSLSSLMINPGTPPGGFGFPFGFNLSFGGGSSVSGAAANAGIFPTLPTARIDGPCTNPKVQNDDAEGGAQFIQLQTTVADGDYILVDFAARTILLNGTASRYNTLTNDSVWWELAPGSSTIQFIVSGATANTKLTLSWRSAWI